VLPAPICGAIFLYWDYTLIFATWHRLSQPILGYQKTVNNCIHFVDNLGDRKKPKLVDYFVYNLSTETSKENI
jgi:hypothetical protein